MTHINILLVELQKSRSKDPRKHLNVYFILKSFFPPFASVLISA